MAVTFNEITTGMKNFKELINVPDDATWVQLWTGESDDVKTGSYVDTGKFTFKNYPGWIKAEDLDDLLFDFAQANDKLIYVRTWNEEDGMSEWYDNATDFSVATESFRTTTVNEDTALDQMFNVENADDGTYFNVFIGKPDGAGGWEGDWITESQYGQGWISKAQLKDFSYTMDDAANGYSIYVQTWAKGYTYGWESWNVSATGNTFTLTAEGAELTSSESSNVTPDDVFLTDNNDTINAGTNLHGSTIVDASDEDQDVLNATINKKTTPEDIQNIEIFNLKFGLGGIMDMDNANKGSGGVQQVNVEANVNGIARFLNVEQDYQINTDMSNLNDELIIDDNASLLMDGDTYTLRGMDDRDEEQDRLRILVESTDAPNVLAMASTALSDDIKVSGDADLTLRNLSHDRVEVQNNLMGAAQLNVIVSNNAVANFRQVDADLFKFDVAFTTAVTFGGTPNVELGKAGNNGVFFRLDRHDTTDTINLMANAGGNIGTAIFGTGVATNRDAFETVNYTVGKNQDVFLGVKNGATVNIDGSSNLTLATNAAAGAMINATELEGNLTMDNAKNVAGGGLGGFVNGGSGDDKISLGAAISAGTRLSIHGGAGDDEININANITGANARVVANAGAGDDEINVTGTVVNGGFLDIRGVSGDNTISLSGNVSGANAKIEILGGTDTDSITFTGRIVTGGAISVNGNAGDNTLIWGAAATGSNNGKLTYEAGSGDDTVIFTKTGMGNIIGADFEFKGEGGDNEVIFGASTDDGAVSATFASDVEFTSNDEWDFVLNAAGSTGQRQVILRFDNAGETLKGDVNFITNGTDAAKQGVIAGNVATGIDLGNVNHDLDYFRIFATTTAQDYKATQGDDLIFAGAGATAADTFGLTATDIHGKNNLWGNEGDDTFIFGAASSATTSVAGFGTYGSAADKASTIKDFEQDGDDKVLLNMTTYSGTVGAADDIVGGKAFFKLEEDILRDDLTVADNHIYVGIKEYTEPADNYTSLIFRYDGAGNTTSKQEVFYVVKLQGTGHDITLDDVGLYEV